jgi:hypothetical protein
MGGDSEAKYHSCQLSELTGFAGEDSGKRLRENSGGFTQRAAFQVSPLIRLGDGVQSPDASFDLLRDWQEILTQSSVRSLHGQD